MDLENAQSARADLRMGAGELNLTGGAHALMEADITYNVAERKPKVNYDVRGDTGELRVRQGSGGGVRFGGDARNEWDIRFNDEVPLGFNVQSGAEESDLGSLTLTDLDLSMGAGETTVDLTGDYERDLAANIEGGVGEAAVRLPGEVGVRVDAEGGLGEINTERLQREGEAYVHDAYGDSEVTLDVDIRGVVGQINLEVVRGVTRGG